jgi:hypothetical protein
MFSISYLNLEISLNFVAFSLLAKKAQKTWRNQAESVSLSVLKALIFSNRVTQPIALLLCNLVSILDKE